jgi:hypothetical protein
VKARIGERDLIKSFLLTSQQFFGSIQKKFERKRSYAPLVVDSYSIVRELPIATLKATRVFEKYPDWVQELGDYQGLLLQVIREE